MKVITTVINLVRHCLEPSVSNQEFWFGNAARVRVRIELGLFAQECRTRATNSLRNSASGVFAGWKIQKTTAPLGRYGIVCCPSGDIIDYVVKYLNNQSRAFGRLWRMLRRFRRIN